MAKEGKNKKWDKERLKIGLHVNVNDGKEMNKLKGSRRMKVGIKFNLYGITCHKSEHTQM